MQYDVLAQERALLKNAMDDEIALVKCQYMPKIKALDLQMLRIKGDKARSEAAANVRKFKQSKPRRS